MFRNRSFLVKVVKDQNTGATDIRPIELDDFAETVTKSAILIIAAYMGADTLRQVIIEVAKAELR